MCGRQASGGATTSVVALSLVLVVRAAPTPPALCGRRTVGEQPNADSVRAIEQCEAHCTALATKLDAAERLLARLVGSDGLLWVVKTGDDVFMAEFGSKRRLPVSDGDERLRRSSGALGTWLLSISEARSAPNDGSEAHRG